MRRRAAADGGVPPEHLIDLGVWIAEGRSPAPGPEPSWWDEEVAGPWGLHEARIEWARARRDWQRDHEDGTLAMVNALFRKGFNDLSPDPRVQDLERVKRVLAAEPRLVQALRAAADAERD